MKLLLTGANGQLGWSLQRLVQAQGTESPTVLEVIPTDLEELDISDCAAVDDFCQQQKPQLVVNAAAYTAVDKAEQEQDLAYRVNAKGPENLAAVCVERKIPLLHVSTDYVYSGSKLTAYLETDPIKPTSVYGETKAMGDAFVQGISGKQAGQSFSAEEIAPAVPRQYIILRTAWVYASHDNNFVNIMLRLAADRDDTNVVADQHGCPTCATAIAAALLEIISLDQRCHKMQWGTYHFAGQGATTWYDFTLEIFKQAKELGLITNIPAVNPITTAEYPTSAKRPANSVLHCSRIRQTFTTINLPKRQDSVAIMLKELQAS